MPRGGARRGYRAQKRPRRSASMTLMRPRILGALFDAAAHGLRRLSRVRLERSPRMADFALWQPPVKRRFGRLVPFCASMQEGPQIFCAPVLPQAKMCRTEPADGQETRAP